MKSDNRSTCWYCGAELIWQGDFNYCDVFDEGEGIATFLSCPGCGAEVTYSLSDSTKAQKQGIFKRIKNFFRRKFF